jgi:hypothetical protein
MHGSVHVHIADSVRAKLAVRITARFGDLMTVSHGKDAIGRRKPGNLRSTGAVPVSGIVPAVCPGDLARPRRIATP